MRTKRRTRVGSRTVDRSSAQPDGSTLTLARLSVLLRGATLVVSTGESGPPHSSFAFGAVDVSGDFDASSGEVVGAGLHAFGDMVTVAWGADAWFERRYRSMVPPPTVRDMRGLVPEGRAVRTARSAGPEGLRVGQCEVVLRMDLAGFVEAVASVSGSGSDGKERA